MVVWPLRTMEERAAYTRRRSHFGAAVVSAADQEAFLSQVGQERVSQYLV